MKKIVFVVSFFLLLYTPYIVHAESVYNIIDELESPKGYDVKEVATEAAQGKIPLTFSEVLKKIASLFFDGIRENIPYIIKLTAIAVLSGLVLNLGGEKNEIGTFAAVAVAATVAVKIFSYAITLTEETIDSLFLFISSMMTPVAAAASTGTVAMGGAAASTFVAMQVFLHICKSVLMPLVCVITVFSVSDKIGEIPYLNGIAAILKQILKWGTGFMITVYSVVIGLQTQAAASMDSLAGKSMKYAVGSFVPVVGATLSDSLETVIAGAKTVASALGVAGIIGVGYICVVPLINICTVSVCFKLASAIASVTSQKRVSSVIEEFSRSIGSVSLILLSVAVMFIISLAMLCGFGR